MHPFLFLLVMAIFLMVLKIGVYIWYSHILKKFPVHQTWFQALKIPKYVCTNIINKILVNNLNLPIINKGDLEKLI